MHYKEFNLSHSNNRYARKMGYECTQKPCFLRDLLFLSLNFFLLTSKSRTDFRPSLNGVQAPAP